MPVDYSALGKRIKEQRAKYKMSQEELANKAGVSIQHISNVENSRTKISLEKLVEVANALHVTVDYLLCDSVVQARPVLQNEVADLLENMSDVELRVLPGFLRELRYYKKILAADSNYQRNEKKH